MSWIEHHYIRSRLNTVAGDIQFLPINAGSTKTVSIFMEGLSAFSITVDDEGMNIALNILSHSLKGIHESYQEKFYFHEPFLSVTPEGKWNLRVRMFEKEIWDQIASKKEE